LGCGQGFTTNILAATHPHSEFWGVDFNPSHTAEAQRLADTAQLKNIRFLDQSFAEFLNADTPEFDYITLHGVYSWIDDDNRRILVDLLRQKLKVGGAVYISYNTLPGWSAMMPLRELMVQYTAGRGGSTLQKVEQGMAFAQQLQSLNASYFRENPTVKQYLQEMQGDSRNYLAHEYFNDHWRPLYHAEVVQDLAAAKLTYAASADIDEQFYNLKLTDDQIQLLANTSDPVLRETIRDFIFNARFRRDLFIKGPIKLTGLEQVELLRESRFALVIPPDEVEYETELADRAVKLDPAIYQPIINALAEGPKTLKALMREPTLTKLDFATIFQALKILISDYTIVPALSEAAEAARRDAIASLNDAILKRSRFGADTQILASPVTGTGIDISRSEQLFLLAHLRQGDAVQYLWNVLQVQGEKLIKDDRVLETPEENRAELTLQYQRFCRVRLPLFKQLGIL
jgi:ubiquinone/menaquinone biosynthesis C-methylase UbiE